MSFNRENVIWQSDDGTWNRGFFKVAAITGDDPEWDVIYDFGSFEWVRVGLRSKQEAEACWTGPNPGGYGFASNHPSETRSRNHYDRMASELISQALR